MQYSSILAGPYDMVICILKQHNSPPISHSDNTLMFSLPVLHGDSLSQAPRLLAHQTRANITLIWPSNMGQGRYIMCVTSFVHQETEFCDASHSCLQTSVSLQFGILSCSFIHQILILYLAAFESLGAHHLGIEGIRSRRKVCTAGKPLKLQA